MQVKSLDTKLIYLHIYYKKNILLPPRDLAELLMSFIGLLCKNKHSLPLLFYFLLFPVHSVRNCRSPYLYIYLFRTLVLFVGLGKKTNTHKILIASIKCIGVYLLYGCKTQPANTPPFVPFIFESNLRLHDISLNETHTYKHSSTNEHQHHTNAFALCRALKFTSD